MIRGILPLFNTYTLNGLVMSEAFNAGYADAYEGYTRDPLYAGNIEYEDGYNEGLDDRYSDQDY